LSLTTIHQIKVDIAFLNAMFDEGMYITPSSNDGGTCKL